MAFIGDNEHILLMDFPNINYEHPAWPMHKDDVKLCFDAGLRTATQFVWWSDIERHKGQYDFANLEEGMFRILNSGMKLLLYTYQYPPSFFQEDWYLHGQDGGRIPVLSLWNEEAQEYEHSFIRMLIERYKGNNILFINSLQRDGETVLPVAPAFYDPHAIAAHKRWTGLDIPDQNSGSTWNWFRQSVLDTVINQQTVFLEGQEHREIWQAYHRMIFHKWTGNQFITDIYKAERDTWKDTIDINVVQFTYTPHGQTYYNLIHKDIQDWKLKVWGGAEYCSGVVTSTNIGLRNGLRGLVCAPVYPQSKRRVEPWMLDNLRIAIEKWKKP